MLNRREFIRTTAAGALGVMAAGTAPLLGRALASDKDSVDLEFDLWAAPDELAVLRGPETGVWRYQGRVAKGSADHLSAIPDSYLGPVFRVRTGQRVRINYHNRIPAESIVHWHGLHVPADMDGHPRLVVPEDGRYIYEFTVGNRAGTYWYHPHPHGTTGHQVYGGMAGLFIVEDDEEAALNLPAGEFDIPLVIQDRVFDSQNRLVYMANGMHDRMHGVMGNTILVNGKPPERFSASARAYRFRILNGANARVYDLSWSDGAPLVVIGNDGGLLETPVKRDHLWLGPGERVDIWADFSGYTKGEQVNLTARFTDGAGGGMMGGMMRRRRPRQRSIAVLPVEVTGKHRERTTLPERLSTHAVPALEEAENYGSPKRFLLQMRHMQGTINGRVFQMQDVARDELVGLNTSEIWEFINGGGHMGMTLPHPMHLHGMQFRIVGRAGVTHDGYLDAGWKDTFLLMPGEAARIHVRFTDYPGLFLYHCHNLEHEDGGMMRNYYVSASTSV